MKVIILAGGSGTRLWPLSRANFSKQFLKLKNGRSLFQMTIENGAAFGCTGAATKSATKGI